MDALRPAWFVVVILVFASPRSVCSQSPRPSETPQPPNNPGAIPPSVPFSVNRTLIVNGVVSGLTPAGQLTPDLEVPAAPSSFELIRIMPTELKATMPSGAILRYVSSHGASSAIGPVATHKTYSLGDLGDDPALGAWLAEMIPQIVQPGTWNKGEAAHKRVLSYYAPAKILLVFHTPTAHSEIEDFLQGVRRSLPQGRAAAKAPQSGHVASGLMPAQFTVPNPPPSQSARPANPAATYPVPAQSQPPKHLFHFIIRYEGDGVIDSNIVDFMKAFPKDESSAPSSPDEKAREAIPIPSPAETADRPDSLPAPKKVSAPVGGAIVPPATTPRVAADFALPLLPDLVRGVLPPLPAAPPIGALPPLPR